MRKVPFYANTEDNLHCTQASLRMVLKHFEPEKEYSWDNLDEMTAFVPGKGTWATASLIGMKGLGYDVVEMSTFEPEAFMTRGGDYLLERYGQEAGRYAIENSNLEQEREFYREFRNLNIHVHQVPELADIRRLLGDGYLVCATINSRKLNNREGFSGHFIVVYGLETKGVYLHDPGLEPIEGRFVENQMFEDAWSVPTPQTRLLYAFRKSRI